MPSINNNHHFIAWEKRTHTERKENSFKEDLATYERVPISFALRLSVAELHRWLGLHPLRSSYLYVGEDVGFEPVATSPSPTDDSNDCLDIKK